MHRVITEQRREAVIGGSLCAAYSSVAALPDDMMVLLARLDQATR